MSYHHNPIEPSDITYGPADQEAMLEVCPVCGEEALDQGDNTYKCSACDWKGPECKYKDPPEYDYEPRDNLLGGNG